MLAVQIVTKHPVPQNNHPERADRFFVLDFDRTLGNTNALYALFQKIIESVVDNDAIHQLDEARHQVEDQGGSFDSIHYVQEILARAGKSGSWQTIVDEFMQQARHTDVYLEPGARNLLAYLDAHNYAYGIVTFGGEQWQKLKIQAVGLDTIPAIVTDTQEKGRLISSWQQPNGSFVVPGNLTHDGVPMIVSSLVLIDDNSHNFESLPEKVTGFYIQNATTRSREYVIPSGLDVHEVACLDDVIKMLNHVIDKT